MAKKKKADEVQPPDLELEIARMDGISNALEAQRNQAASDAAKFAGQVTALLKINQRQEAKLQAAEQRSKDLEQKNKQLEEALKVKK